MGFSLYEGRTRGKRIKYTFSDEEGATSDGISTRRSNRRSGVSTPAESAGPTFTASGRQVRARGGGAYGESALSGQNANTNNVEATDIDHTSDGQEQPTTYGRGQRSAGRSTRNQGSSKNVRSYDGTDEDSAASTSGEDWDGGDDDDVDDQMVDEVEDQDLEMSDDEVSIADGDDQGTTEDNKQRSLVVSLRYQRKLSPRPPEVSASQGETPLMNGGPGSTITTASDVQPQKASQQPQQLDVRPGPSIQDIQPTMQDAKDIVLKNTIPSDGVTQPAP